jgi:enoyl-CoA hydratase/carnithine racemase
MSKQIWHDTIQTIDENGVYKIVLNRPAKRNAFSSRMYHELKLGVLAAGVHPDVDSIVVEGQPGVFASGGDLAEFLNILELPPHEFLPAFAKAFEEPLPFRAILECPKPVVAKIDGLCLAGGLVVAAACDVSIATKRSVFGVPEARVGLADPFCATLLPPSIGLSRARYLMLTAETINADVAMQWGILHKVVDEDKLDSAVEATLESLRRTSPDARRAYKKAANDTIPHMSTDTVLRPVLSANGREGLKAFVEKRLPNWDRSSTLI